MSTEPYALADEAAAQLRSRFGLDAVDLAFVLGSGWSAAADDLGEPVGSCALDELPGFARPAVAGHGGELRLVRTASGRTAAVLTGRTHYYEGRGVAPVVHGVRTVAAAGASTLVLTNGCGGLNPDWGPGTPVLIRDHVNLTATSPLEGATFLDLTDLYSPRLRALCREVEPSLEEGVYVQFPGPHYETPAEVAMVRSFGGDLVGMSTALEAIAARAAGMEIFGLSMVTNAAAGITGEKLDHEEVLAAGKAAAGRLGQFLVAFIGRLP